MAAQLEHFDGFTTTHYRVTFVGSNDAWRFDETHRKAVTYQHEQRELVVMQPRAKALIILRKKSPVWLEHPERQSEHDSKVFRCRTRERIKAEAQH